MSASVSDLHDEAMEYATEAHVLRCREQDPLMARALWQKALHCERAAAMFFATLTGPDVEPTRSVLFRSAACIALAAGDPSEAVRLARLGLTEHTHREIAEELHEAIAFAEAGLFRGRARAWFARSAA